MSILFGTVASTDNIDFGNGSSINVNDYTYLAWVYRLTAAQNQFILSKGGAPDYGVEFLYDDNTSSGRPEIRSIRAHSTTAAQAIAAFGTSRIRQWECVAATYNSATRVTRLGIGTESLSMYEPAYRVLTTGSGSLTGASAYSVRAGNMNGVSLPLFGLVAWVAIYPRVLTYAEMELWRLKTLSGIAPNIPDARLLARTSGPGRVIDLSGNNNHGTRTGGLISASEPTAPVALSDAKRLWFLPAGGLSSIAGTSSNAFGHGSSTLTGAGALAGTAANVFGQSAALTGTAAASGSAAIVFGGAGLALGAGALSGAAPMTLTPIATAAGSGALAGSAALTFAATLQGAGALSGSAALQFGQAASLTGTGALSGSADLQFGQAATLGGVGALAGSALMTLDGVLALTPTQDAAVSLGGRKKRRRLPDTTEQELRDVAEVLLPLFDLGVFS